MSSVPHRPSSINSTMTAFASQSSSASTSSINRNRQYAHLHAQLAQLNAHLADMENLVGMTAVQADYVRGLGGWWGAGFMAASKILGEETADGTGAVTAAEREKAGGQK